MYSLVNARSGTAVDLSGADSKSIIGYPSHSGKNQQVCPLLSASFLACVLNKIVREYSGGSNLWEKVTPYGVYILEHTLP